MGDLDDYDYGDDRDGRDDGDEQRSEVSCRHCGSTDVYWGHDSSGKWELYALSSRRHRCKPADVTAYREDAFDAL